MLKQTIYSMMLAAAATTAVADTIMAPTPSLTLANNGQHIYEVTSPVDGTTAKYTITINKSVAGKEQFVEPSVTNDGVTTTTIVTRSITGIDKIFVAGAKQQPHLKKSVRKHIHSSDPVLLNSILKDISNVVAQAYHLGITAPNDWTNDANCRTLRTRDHSVYSKGRAYGFEVPVTLHNHLKNAGIDNQTLRRHVSQNLARSACGAGLANR